MRGRDNAILRQYADNATMRYLVPTWYLGTWYLRGTYHREVPTIVPVAGGASRKPFALAQRAEMSAGDLISPTGSC